MSASRLLIFSYGPGLLIWLLTSKSKLGARNWGIDGGVIVRVAVNVYSTGSATF